MESHKKSRILLNEWNIKVKNITDLSLLDKKLSLVEINASKTSQALDDIEMIQVYLYKSKIQRGDRTIKIYKDELVLFVEHLISYGQAFEFDIDAVVDRSLMKTLTTIDLRKYQEWLATNSPYVKRKGKYSTATLERKVSIIKSFLSFLYDNNYIDNSIHNALYIDGSQKNKTNREFGPYEVVQLMDYFRETNNYVTFSIIHVLIATGLQSGEFCRLRVKDLKYNLKEKGYYLQIIGRGNKQRQVPLKEKAYNSLLIFRKERDLKDLDVADPESPLFITATGKGYSPSYLSQFLSKEFKRSGLPLLSHDNIVLGPQTFRHTFAIISMINNRDIYEIHRLLGHDSIRTTCNYMEKIFPIESHPIFKWNSESFGRYI
ncbi:tyrosine-type recombinase/integrase [Psychrobacillus sp.]|uniref:tyrosine-type recombinase/integrase n=1 Tax=Psychrobacillus sp. TaxID=1871623 RepID=UPI0028BE9612|nr:tyrosine-type recombinase/integrase [Psychrobacillus sp.]